VFPILLRAHKSQAAKPNRKNIKATAVKDGRQKHDKFTNPSLI
jgi:hypothetical protein